MSARIGRVFSVTVTTALYRRYRPDSFADVIGQEHVTEPLMTALRKNRVNHAYLFSGPRGCGKTTSARILARCLNCATGPTDTPCGTCASCIELARGGSGSLDVIEIDAASHGGVDDARDLRERATYAPVRDRYKIFIIDEAHMVTSAGFNALLKIVEEPPEHIKFIFATTEPDKVIGTIRSRTHHYPFRLVPPEPLMAYLELLCRQENVPVAPGVLSLVIRAGAGSVRDSLSVLDQLMAGAGPNGLDYELAVALLGYTHASLLDDVVEAVAASDAATVFRAVDRVIQTGHDPRRFVEDLLERFRDLIIVQAMPESAQTILRGMPADQIARLQVQAHNLGAAELSRAADVTNTALTEMTGATSPRLHLELLCARILLPSSEQTERGIAARIDRVERRLNYGGNDVGTPPAPASAVDAAPADALRSQRPQVPEAALAGGTPSPRQAAQSVQAPASGQAPQSVQSAASGQVSASPAAEAPGTPRSTEAASPRQPLTAPRVSTTDWPVDETATARPAAALDTNIGRGPAPASPAPVEPVPAEPALVRPTPVKSAAVAPPLAEEPVRAAETASPASSSPTHGTGARGDVEVLRRAWPEILQTLSRIKRSTWALVEPNAQVGAFDGQVLTLAFSTSGLAGAFGRADHAENLRQAIHKTVGIDCQITAVAGGINSPASAEPNPKAPASPEATATPADVAWGLAPAGGSAAPDAGAPGDAATPQSTARAQASATPDEQPPLGPGNRQAKIQEPSGRKADPAEPSSAQSTGTQSTGTQSTGTELSGTGVSATAAAPAVPARGEPKARTEAPSVPAAPVADPGPGQDPDAADSYAYSDDDWGPPRDEDAPPLDEEPPLDWVPSAPVAPPSGASATRAAAPAKGGSAGAAARAASASALPASAANGDSGNGNGNGHDPWTRAVEQAPGVWVIGDDSNLGKSVVVPAADEAVGPAAPAPVYEPAAAQVPVRASERPPAAAGNPEPDTDAEWGLTPVSDARPAPGSEAPSHVVPEPEPAFEPDLARAPVYAMASSAPQAAPTQPAQATAPSAAAARQSLYQRLSSSPEAAAGRAKVPVRRAGASDTYVQDVPSADDETIEESGVFGRAAVERILGGKLIEERSLDGSPLPPRY